MDKIQKRSLFFKRLFIAAMVFIPLKNLFLWIVYKTPFGDMILQYVPPPTILMGIPILAPLTPLTRMLAFLVDMIPSGINMIMLYFLVKLFDLYFQGLIFTSENVRRVRQIGITLLIGQVLFPVYDGLMSLVLTMNNPVGERLLRITISHVEIVLFVIAFVIILVSWIMDEARKLNEEQALIV
ncbi:MAG: DUF2975 domain-containing protein [Pseudomonadota bacterium]